MSAGRSGGGEQWATRIGVILAVAGSAVGLGNFLRFPGNAAQNGGGAFMLPYFISLLILGIPLCWVEWTMGRYAGVRGFHSAPGIFTVIWRHPAAKYFGGFALLIPLIIYMYYVLIEAWCLGYAMNYLTGDLMMGNDPEAYTRLLRGLRRQADGTACCWSRVNRTWLWILLGTFVFNFVLIYRGVSKGIETFCRVAMPLMVILALIVLVRVLTLGTPDPTNRTSRSSAAWASCGTPTCRSTLESADLAGGLGADLLQSVGWVWDHRQLRQLRPPQRRRRAQRPDVVQPERVLRSLPRRPDHAAGRVHLPRRARSGETSARRSPWASRPCRTSLPQMPAGRFFGFLWFFMLFVAAITSSVSMLQPVIAFFEEGFGLKRHASAAVLGHDLGVRLRFCALFLQRPGGPRYVRFLGRQRPDLYAGPVPVAYVRLDVWDQAGRVGSPSGGTSSASHGSFSGCSSTSCRSI